MRTPRTRPNSEQSGEIPAAGATEQPLPRAAAGGEDGSEEPQAPRYPYRVFLSYSHADGDLAHKVYTVLKKLKLDPVMDRHITAGTPFTEAIKGMISRAHIFMPILTASAKSRPWVHQEIGYATALRVPVLPLAVGKVPGQMIAQLQAVPVKENPAPKDLRHALEPICYRKVVLSEPAPPNACQEVADWPETRTELMAQSAMRVIALGHHDKVRQRAALTSFCLPDADLGDEVWRLRDGDVQRSKYLHHLQREERRALELHARRAGCDLIIDPEVTLKVYGDAARRVRLQCLVDFLKSCPAGKVRAVVASPHTIGGNLTIVGDWFTAESMAPRPGEGYRQTLFIWHAPSVLRQIERFDDEFKDLKKAQGQVGPDVDNVVRHLQGLIEAIPLPPQPPSAT
jgi:hypothetical protein